MGFPIIETQIAARIQSLIDVSAALDLFESHPLEQYLEAEIGRDTMCDESQEGGTEEGTEWQPLQKTILHHETN